MDNETLISACQTVSWDSDAATAEVDKLLGARFELGGRGPESWDCLGLALRLVLVGWNMRVPDPARGLGGARHFDLRRWFTEVEAGQAGDVLHVIAGTKLSEQHLAVFEDRYTLAEADRLAGVRRAKLWEHKHRPVKVYRLRACQYP